MNKVFEDVAKTLQPILPKGWNKVCLYAEITEKSYEILFYCFINGKIKPIQCYNLSEEYQIEEDDIDVVFQKVNDILKSIWLKLKESDKETWSNYTLVFESTGKFSEYYDYSDLSEGSYEYKKIWKDKYLK